MRCDPNWFRRVLLSVTTKYNITTFGITTDCVRTLSLITWHGIGIQKHFLCTMPGPESSYSSFEIHISWKVESEERMEPPIQTEYFLSGGATIFTLIEAGAKAVISLVRRTSMLGN